jgi:hypothetical protein
MRARIVFLGDMLDPIRTVVLVCQCAKIASIGAVLAVLLVYSRPSSTLDH